ncbi:MAG: L,D-transpeptidase [Gammaproteobacteria bacterium]|nr:MAG: L,D-transpeptidase [Gammaproteobacteria bacterium]
MKLLFKTTFLLLLFAAPKLTWATSYPLPPIDNQLIGQVQKTLARQEDTLLDIARHYDIGQKEILLANPAVDRWIPGGGTEVTIPSRFILPDAPKKGIVLNVPEMRLYHFRKENGSNPKTVTTHPVSIGRMDWTTPLGQTRITQKTENPVWRPPESIKKEHAEEGEILPDIVPAGPDNPLGLFALRLGIPGYLIHSTNKPFGVGMRVSHGCVRMYPEDIERLFPNVKVGTPVLITNQPIKVGWFTGELYIEVHPALDEESTPYEERLSKALDLIEKANDSQLPVLNGLALRKALHEQNGIPIMITK